jgi:hypothetical protein
LEVVELAGVRVASEGCYRGWERAVLRIREILCSMGEEPGTEGAVLYSYPPLYAHEANSPGYGVKRLAERITSAGCSLQKLRLVFINFFAMTEAEE